MAKKRKPLAYLWTLSWYTPYSEPPDGKPRRLMSVRQPGDTTPRPPPEMETARLANPGYVLCWQGVLPEREPWPQERLIRYRRSRLRNRIEKKYPLFANEFFQEALERKPEYYGT